MRFNNEAFAEDGDGETTSLPQLFSDARFEKQFAEPSLALFSTKRNAIKISSDGPPFLLEIDQRGINFFRPLSRGIIKIKCGRHKKYKLGFVYVLYISQDKTSLMASF
jgi:hypothetical protein